MLYICVRIQYLSFPSLTYFTLVWQSLGPSMWLLVVLFHSFYGWVVFHWKRLWCWEGLWGGGKGDDRGWDGWMASPVRWMWVWVNSGSWWWTGRPGMLWFMGSQRVGYDWATELNWTEYSIVYMYHIFFIHSSANGHLCCFLVLAIVNSPSENTGVHMSFWTKFFSGCMPRSGNAGSYGSGSSVSHSVVSNFLQPHGLQPTRLLCPWDSPGKNTGVGSRSLLQGISLTRGLNSALLHCRQILYHLSHQGNVW